MNSVVLHTNYVASNGSWIHLNLGFHSKGGWILMQPQISFFINNVNNFAIFIDLPLHRYYWQFCVDTWHTGPIKSFPKISFSEYCKLILDTMVKEAYSDNNETIKLPTLLMKMILIKHYNTGLYKVPFTNLSVCLCLSLTVHIHIQLWLFICL